jgi:hypothetical protein
MNNFLIAPTRRATLRTRPVALALALTIAAGGAVIGLSSGEEPAVPAQRQAAPNSPIIFGDAPVAKGAHGRAINAADGPSRNKVFGDPRVRKGARGR